MSMKIKNPATGTILTEVATTPVEDLPHYLKTAKITQRQWAQEPIERRLGIITRFRDLLAADIDAAARLLTSETGKPITQAENELRATLPRLDYFLDETPRLIKAGARKAHHDPKTLEQLSYEPLGLVANISAWNYPYFIGTNVFIPALICGNAVAYKPSEFSSLTGEHMANLLYEAGLPEELFTLIIGDSRQGNALAHSPEIDALFFTGSMPTGKEIHANLGGRLIRSCFELGGKDPAYCASDADLERAVAGIFDGAFYNNGQSCCAVERVYVHEKCFEAFIDGFVSQLASHPMGDPLDHRTYFGPLTREASLSHYQTQIDDACQKGATLLKGGHRLKRDGHYFEPTILLNVNHSMQVMREETFGPVIGIQLVTSDDEAIEKMADTQYGLTASVYTSDLDRGEKILKSLNVGTAYINCCDRVSPNLPWSGRGGSGLGSTLGEAGILAMVQPKAWHIRA